MAFAAGFLSKAYFSKQVATLAKALESVSSTLSIVALLGLALVPLAPHGAAFTKATMLDKNHDYGEAWRDMSQESFADLILVKLLRIRQILANDGKTLISEGIDANYVDIINYSVFALILIEEGKHKG